MKYQPISLTGLRTVSLSSRHSKVQVGDFTGIPHANASLQQFLEALPNILLQRPASVGGTAMMLNGRPELFLPLLAFAVVEALETNHA